jgi:hypothetical protein
MVINDSSSFIFFYSFLFYGSVGIRFVVVLEKLLINW